MHLYLCSLTVKTLSQQMQDFTITHAGYTTLSQKTVTLCCFYIFTKY